MVHGGPGAGMNAVFPDLQPLARNYTVIFYDQRGGGRSDLPADTTRLDARFFVEDMEAVRRFFGLHQMKIIAHSFGSVLMARYLQDYPERVSRMVFLGATGPKRSEAGKLAMQRYAEMDSVDFAQLGAIMQVLFSGTAADPVAACNEYEGIIDKMAIKRGEPNNWLGASCDMPLEAVAYYYKYTARIAPATFGDWDFTEKMQGITTPLLVVYGALDSSGLSLQRAWAEAFPDGKLMVVPEAGGKTAIADQPDVVFPAINSFFASDWPEGAE